MNLESIARAYMACVELEERTASQAPQLADDVSILRADLHAILMEALRQAKIPFSDRSEAAQIAFNLARGKQPVP